MLILWLSLMCCEQVLLGVNADELLGVAAEDSLLVLRAATQQKRSRSKPLVPSPHQTLLIIPLKVPMILSSELSNHFARGRCYGLALLQVCSAQPFQTLGSQRLRRRQT